MNHRHLVGATAGAVCLTAALSAGQDALEFDFVSVRRSASATPSAGTPGVRGGLLVLPDGRFEARGQALANLARVAFGFDHVDPSRGVVQAVDWMWNDRFDITASAGRPWTAAPPGTSVPAELRTMLRALLEDRFALRARIVTRKVDVTALRLVKPDRLGPGVRSSSGACGAPSPDGSPDEAQSRPGCPIVNTRDGIQARAVTMREVAQLLSQNLSYSWNAPIVDQTGLSDRYDISFSLPRGVRTTGSLRAELEAQLGLRLAGTRIPAPALVIERARKPRED